MHHGGVHLLLACGHPLLRWASAISCCRSGTVMPPGAGVGRVLLGGAGTVAAADPALARQACAARATWK
eukprot:294598-Prymnesium_polylepis.1